MRASRPIWAISVAVLGLVVIIALGSVLLDVSAQTQIGPTLTPPGLPGKIAFTSKRDGHDQVYLMNPDGSGQINVSQDDSNDSQPAWSPDGLQIAFASQREGNNEICIMNADGSNQKCLTHQPTPGRKANPKLPQDYAPTWSPDGLHIAFVSTRTGNSDIWAVNIDGTNPINLTQSSSNNDHPAWSPDLKSIAFISDRDGNSEICVMDASGFNQRCLTNERTANHKPDKNKAADSYPAWSPDSQKIAFVSTREKNRNKQIFIMNADGSNPINVTQKISSDDHPTWSPDGTLLAFMSNRDGLINDLYVTNLDGSTQTRVTQTIKGGDFFPVWVPDGSHLTGTPTETLTPTPLGTIHFTPIPTDTPVYLSSGGLVQPITPSTPVPPVTATLYFPPANPPNANTSTYTPTNTSTFTSTPTNTSTFTSTPTSTSTFTSTPTITPTPCVVTRYTVTNESDYKDGFPNNGSTFPTYYPSNPVNGTPGTLRYIVGLATYDVSQAIYLNQAGSPVPIPVPRITFCPNVQHIALATANDPITIPVSMDIQGNSPQFPVISGSNITDIFFIENYPPLPYYTPPDTVVNMNNLAIVGGKPTQGTQYRGGAITLSTGQISENGGTPSLKLNNVTLQNNIQQFSAPGAGAIYLDSYALLTTTTTNFFNNTGVIAGAVYVAQSATFTANSNTVIQGNNAIPLPKTDYGGWPTGDGGGVYVDGGGTLFATSSTFTGNTASDSGGGIYGYGYCGDGSGGATITLNTSTVSNNTATNNGGGIYNGFSLTLNGSSVINNTDINGNGAGIYNYQAIAGCTLGLDLAKLNTSKAASSSAGPKGATIINSTIANNKSGGQGGAIYSNGPLTIQNSQITNNTAQSGGGLYIAGGSLTLDNQTVISGNQASGGADSYVAPSANVIGGSNIAPSLNIANPTATGTATATPTAPHTPTGTNTATATLTATLTATNTATATLTATHTATATLSPTHTPTFTLTPTPTFTLTPTPTFTLTPTSTFTITPTPTFTITPTPTFTITPTSTFTITPTPITDTHKHDS